MISEPQSGASGLGIPEIAKSDQKIDVALKAAISLARSQKRNGGTIDDLKAGLLAQEVIHMRGLREHLVVQMKKTEDGKQKLKMIEELNEMQRQIIEVIEAIPGGEPLAAKVPKFDKPDKGPMPKSRMLAAQPNVGSDIDFLNETRS